MFATSLNHSNFWKARKYCRCWFSYCRWLCTNWKVFVILYSLTLNTDNTNNIARLILFMQGGQSLENIPPTFSCLQKHILRSCHQATKWYNALLKQRLNLDLRIGVGRNQEKVLYLYGVTSLTHLKHVVN